MLIGPPEQMAPAGERELLVLILALLRYELEDDMPSAFVRELIEYAQLLATAACGVDT